MSDDYTPINARAYEKYQRTSAEIHFSEATNMEAHMAYQLIVKWGMVAGVDNGEDSAGRTSFRLSTPDELVERALTTAETFYRAVRKKGWTVPTPLPLTEVKDDDQVAAQT